MNQIPPQIHESWNKYLQPLFDNPKMQMIKETIKGGYYPSVENVFRVFSMPIGDIKVVICGMDPYPNGEGIGLAFAVNMGTKIPPSLKIIKEEVNRTESRMSFFMRNTVDENFHINRENQDQWRTLQHWVDQGVFLLNTALTVEPKNSGSHIGYWLWFTRVVIETISIVAKPVWLLWGNKAQSFKSNIHNFIEFKGNITKDIIGDSVSNQTNYILTAPHPAAEKYSNKDKFTGSNHFNLCNEILKLKGEKLINW